MDEKNIFSELNFTPVKETDLIISKENIDKISRLFNEIFESSGATQQIYITKTLEDEALAISTAEDSSLTAAEAAKIQITDEQSLRIKKYQSMSDPIEKKYEMLEYENIKSVSSQSTGVSFQHLNIEILCHLHHDLTLGLDDYTGELKISRYHSGVLRNVDTVKIGKFPPYQPPEHTRIKTLLEMLFKYYQEKTDIHLVDILEFGLLLYAIHPFQNGNKRVVRVIESALLEFYDYSAKGSISLGRSYAIEKTGFNHFLLHSLNNRNTTAFVNFALRRYAKDGEFTLQETMKDTAKIRLKTEIIPFLNEKKRSQFEIAFRLFEEQGFLTNSAFTRAMKEQKYTHSIAQSILKVLTEDGVIQKLPDGTYTVYELKRFKKLIDNLEVLMKNTFR